MPSYTFVGEAEAWSSCPPNDTAVLSLPGGPGDVVVLATNGAVPGGFSGGPIGSSQWFTGTWTPTITVTGFLTFGVWGKALVFTPTAGWLITPLFSGYNPFNEGDFSVTTPPDTNADGLLRVWVATVSFNGGPVALSGPLETWTSEFSCELGTIGAAIGYAIGPTEVTAIRTGPPFEFIDLGMTVWGLNPISPVVTDLYGWGVLTG